MGFRRLMIENPAELSVQRGQLTIRTEAKTASFPLEDLDAVLIEDRRVKWSVAVPAMLAEHGCALILCDERHMPCCVLSPFMQHSRQLGMLRLQFELSEPRKKRLWQSIVRQKIRNQAACLSQFGLNEPAEHLGKMALAVMSGDSSFVEGAAAAYYFRALFGEAFSRDDDEDGRNAALNYGYAIVRAAVARSLTLYGLLPCLGLHHRSELNAFNLADDLIEPFRPLVDRAVRQMVSPEDRLLPETKRMLFDLLSMDMEVNGRQYCVSYAIELLVQGLLRSLRGGEERLSAPVLSEQKRHRYE